MKEEDRLANRVIAYAKEAGKDIFAMTDRDWLKYRNVGQKCLAEIRELLSAMDRPKNAPLGVRDMFAMAALQWLGLARPNHTYEEIVEISYDIADRMMKERRKRKTHGSAKFSDQQIREWAERHDLMSRGSLLDLRCAFEDAASSVPNRTKED